MKFCFLNNIAQESKHKCYKSFLASRMVSMLGQHASYQKAILGRIWEKQIEALQESPLKQWTLSSNRRLLTFGKQKLYVGDFVWTENACGIIVGFLPTSFHDQFACILEPCQCLSQEHFGSTWQLFPNQIILYLKKSMHVDVPSWWSQNVSTNIITCLM